ncbi:Reverse transcriptase domain-containing protein, partial [Aphis craccivora]
MSKISSHLFGNVVVLKLSNLADKGQCWRLSQLTNIDSSLRSQRLQVLFILSLIYTILIQNNTADFSKAFDSIDDGTLCLNLNLLGVGEPLLFWIKSYLYNRSQFINLCDFVSHKCLLLLCNALVRTLLKFGFINRFLNFASHCFNISHPPRDYGPIYKIVELKPLSKRCNKLYDNFSIKLPIRRAHRYSLSNRTTLYSYFRQYKTGLY